MAIAYVGGASAPGAHYNSPVVTATITYSPTAGNTIIVTLTTTGGGTPVLKDNNGNTVPLLSQFFVTLNQWVWVGIAITGATSYVFTSMGSSFYTAVLSEYSGVASVGGYGTSASVSGSGSGGPLTATANARGGIGSWIVGCFAADKFNIISNNTAWASTNNLRDNSISQSYPVPLSTSNTGAAIVDNTIANSNSGTPVSVQASVTNYNTPVDLQCVTIELVQSTAATYTITITSSGNAGEAANAASFVDFTGASFIAPDGSSASNNPTTLASLAVPSFTPTANGDVIYTSTVEATSTAVVITPSAGFTAENNIFGIDTNFGISGFRLADAYEILATAGAITPGYSYSPNAQSFVLAAAFRASAGISVSQIASSTSPTQAGHNVTIFCNAKPKAGDLLFMTVTNRPSTITISDTMGLTWNLIVSNGFTSAIYWALVPLGIITTLRFTGFIW